MLPLYYAPRHDDDEDDDDDAGDCDDKLGRRATAFSQSYAALRLFTCHCIGDGTMHYS